MPFAVAKALTLTARDAAAAEAEAIVQVFDNPTPFTRRAAGYTPATKASLRSVIFLKDAQADYLLAQVEGGARDLKRFEQRFGAIDGAALVMPGVKATLNQYGNISKAKILAIARDLNTGGKAKRFFKGTPRGHSLPPGIWARVNNNTAIAPIMVFATDAQYEKRFEFSAIAQQTVDAVFERHLLAAWDLAVRTAR